MRDRLHILLRAQLLKKIVLASCKTYFLLFIIISCALLSHAQKRDTLPAVKVYSPKDLHTVNTPVPVQVLGKEALGRINSISVADAVKYFAGVNVKDYGGIGGLKTVSLRSLGANHTGVSYDGFLLGDAQGGQADLGKFSLDNIEEIALYTGGNTEILLPARAFASASLLSLKTAAAVFNEKEKSVGTVQLKQGSFGYISPAASYRARISKKLQMSLDGFYEYAKGDYPFASYENNGPKEKRNNSDIRAFRGEYNAGYKLNDSSIIRFKTYYYHSKRGLPGAFVLYNPIAGQQLDDDNFFMQSSWQHKISKKHSLLLGAKFSQDKSHYLDPSYPNSAGKLENNFRQSEIYFSAAYKYMLTNALSASISSDYFTGRLRRTDIFAGAFAAPTRNSFLNNIAVKYREKYFEAGGNLLYTVLNEKVLTGNSAHDLHKFAGGFSFSAQPIQSLPLKLRGFYQHIFRAPTFNDLYYTNVGNTDLLPERAEQYDIGLTMHVLSFYFIQSLDLTCDAYFNKVKDKILAVPRQNLFQWSEQNIGKVNIKGTDVAAHFRLMPMGIFRITSDLSYSFQQALDISDKNSTLYKTQLPYTPKHSGSADISINYKSFGLSWNLLFSSYRYRSGDPIPENLVQGFSTDDLSFNWSFSKSENADYKLTAEANNIFNTQYEIIRYYPMPRFNYRIGIIASFKK